MAPERRRDPSDGAMYTYDEAFTYYRSLRYKPEVINAYWDHEMLPAKTAKRVPAAKAPRAAKAAPEAKSKAKPKEKPKAKAKATPEPKAKGKAKAKAKAKTKVAGPANPKRFINDEGSIVQDSVDGLIWSTENLARLDGYPDIKVVYRTDWSKDKVALISGGGAGHEPMHGGFVGQGLLTAAISGETFASPSIDAVLAAIVQVTGPKGCLLVIKNYTGDRLNFTLAAQKARSIYGLQVETVIVKDDVATSAERGICGTLFVHKVAGAMSEEGKSLADIKTQVEQVICDSVSLGVSMSVVRRLKAESIGLKKMEVGLGIHGEPGARPWLPWAMKIAAESPEWREFLDEILKAAPKQRLPWPELQQRALQKLTRSEGGAPRAARGKRRKVALEVLAHLPAAYVNPRDPFVRLPQTPQTPTPRGDSLRVICCGDLHALRHEIQAAARQKEAPLVVVDFSSELCLPCARLKPEIHELSLEMPEVVFLEVDVEMNSEAADAYGVTSLPTFIFFKQKKLLCRYEGSDVDQLTLKLLEYK